jgi:hypothetical protein
MKFDAQQKMIPIGDKSLLFAVTSIEKSNLWVKRKQPARCLVLVPVPKKGGELILHRKRG